MPRTPPRSPESWRACRTRCATSRSTDRETAESGSQARFFRHSLAPWNSGSRYRRAVASPCAMTTPIGKMVKIVSMAAGGLHYAHDLADAEGKPLGLVHRDISPDNILVHRNGMAKVVDFGIAKAANSSGRTRTGALKGKVAYMPPEQ